MRGKVSFLKTQHALGKVRTRPIVMEFTELNNKPPFHPFLTLGSLTALYFFDIYLYFFLMLGNQHKYHKEDSRSNRTTRLQWYPGPSWISWITRYPRLFWTPRTTRTTWLWQSDTLFVRKTIQRWENPGHLC